MDTTAILESIAGYNRVINDCNNSIAVLDKQDQEIDAAKKSLEDLRGDISQEIYNFLSNTSFVENTGEWVGTKYDFYLEGRRTLIQYENEYVSDIDDVTDNVIPRKKKEIKNKKNELNEKIKDCREKIDELESMLNV